MPIIYLNVSLSQYYQPGAASTQGDESFRYFGLFVQIICVHTLVSGAQLKRHRIREKTTKHTCCGPFSIDGLLTPPS